MRPPIERGIIYQFADDQTLSLTITPETPGVVPTISDVRSLSSWPPSVTQTPIEPVGGSVAIVSLAGDTGRRGSPTIPCVSDR